MSAPRPLLVVTVVGILGFLVACEEQIDRAILRVWDPADYSLLEDGELHVVLCGTGTPIPTDERAQPCVAIVAGGEFLLVDVGPGAIRQADLLELPVSRLSGIFVTHFHSDHVGGLGEALAHSWFRGRENTVTVVGPPGIEKTTAAFVEAFALDTELRALPMGDELDPRWRVPEVREVEVEGDEARLAFERNGVRVKTFAVDHSPVTPAYGYRIEYAGRSVVVSGDTRAHQPLAMHARGADLLIHSAAIVPEFTRENLLRLQERGELPRVALDLFATPVEAAEIAEQAGVVRLVLTHLGAVPVNVLTRWFWLRGVGDVFEGDVVLAEDGMRFDLAPREAQGL